MDNTEKAVLAIVALLVVFAISSVCLVTIKTSKINAIKQCHSYGHRTYEQCEQLRESL